MSDAEMMRFMAGCMLAEGPAPSVETPLHSLLPHRVIVHTHDIATMSLTNVPDGVAERLVGELFEGAIVYVPQQPPSPWTAGRRKASRGSDARRPLSPRAKRGPKPWTCRRLRPPRSARGDNRKLPGGRRSTKVLRRACRRA